ncbi:PREDICTED: uncharacterized protein LOC109219999 [Nicotiana attenuata]|uniref:uncharacterized protein LOC109219999 n=1 Tax=Nicotiana attenuata TaxID=49451 RepID=UPI000905D540|nr:PREDICTED: uncharacterized protein LOC109219999 [Nicotiana attenuata]
MDAVLRGDSDCSMVGKTIILPSSHTGVPRYRAQNYQDVMTICRWAGYPDFFLTFTCNPEWPEINEMLRLSNQEGDDSRVDIICRVFQIKLFQLMQDLKKQQSLGKIIAYDHIDKLITAEIPDLEVDPDGYNVVKNFMMHGPCGEHNHHCPCMKQGKCTKHFPKKFNDRTTFDADGFPIYKRRNTGTQVKKNGVLLDNRYVVPYNKNLIVKFGAHINVELCNYSRSVKYLFKYVNKGSDRATTTVECTDTAVEIDEIKRYLDCRYISATEACWRIFKFGIHHKEPAVERLPFQLEGKNPIIFEEERDKTWTKRRNGNVVGRIYFAHPGSGERFYLRMLLNFFKGCTSFESIRRINGVTHENYKDACYALGLLEDDKEWNGCLAEAVLWATGNELRNLFVTILIHCQVTDCRKIWKTNFEILSEDIISLQRKRFRLKDLQLTKKQLEAYTLFEIESILLKIGKSLKDIDGMPLPDSALLNNAGNRLITTEELDYDKDALKWCMTNHSRC